MHGKRAVTYIRLQQCTCCNHHDHHRHHKQKRISKRAKHAAKHEVQVHTQMQLIRSHTRSSKHAQQLKHFKNANQKLEYAEHPSLSHRENKLQCKNIQFHHPCIQCTMSQKTFHKSNMQISVAINSRPPNHGRK